MLCSMLRANTHTSHVIVISCLGCGCTRATRRTETGRIETAECGFCGDLGWTYTATPADGWLERGIAARHPAAA